MSCVAQKKAQEFQATLDSCHTNIRWGHDPSSTQHGVFLDLELSLERNGDHNKLEWKMHRKPQSIFQYIPLSSPKFMFSSVVQGELQRIGGLNQRAEDRQRQQKFFINKLAERGYPRRWLSAQLHKHTLKNKVVTTQAFARRSSGSRAFLKLQFDRSYSCIQISRFLNRHVSRLRKSLNIDVVQVAWCCQRNMFRLLYRYNWGRRSSSW